MVIGSSFMHLSQDAAKLAGLQKLSIWHSSFEEWSVLALALSCLCSLEELCVWGAGVSSRGAALIAQHVCPAALVKLDVRGLHTDATLDLGDEASGLLAFSRLTALRSLSIHGHRDLCREAHQDVSMLDADEGGRSFVSALASLANLERLSLSCTGVEWKVLRGLAISLQSLVALQCVFLNVPQHPKCAMPSTIAHQLTAAAIKVLPYGCSAGLFSMYI